MAAHPSLLYPPPPPQPLSQMELLFRGDIWVVPLPRKTLHLRARMLFPTGPGTTCSSHTRRDKVDRLKLLLLYPGPLTEQGGQQAAVRLHRGRGFSRYSWPGMHQTELRSTWFSSAFTFLGSFYHLHPLCQRGIANLNLRWEQCGGSLKNKV